MPRYADDDHAMSGGTVVPGMAPPQGRRGEDERAKSREAALRGGGVGAFAVEQAAPGGRRQPGRVRRSASQRMRARQRAGLDVGDIEGGAGGGGGGGGVQVQEMNPADMLAADVEIEQMIMEDDEEVQTIGFWHLDKTDKVICGGICFLVVALIVVLAIAMT
ncbi:hypothetical protein ACHAXA_001079 [Cyclostephanos tholiformis]|uniref:Uncharacterized protein n=1 Tax=Cyclostephanos tholiformis TaxID=382380 RepID=A0ABD3R555_9STRA